LFRLLVNIELCRGTVDAALYRVGNEEVGNRFRSGVMSVKAAGWCSGCAGEETGLRKEFNYGKCVWLRGEEVRDIIAM
jgi:hypothetical protein